MEIFYYDQEGVMLVAIPQFVDECFRERVNASEIGRFKQRSQKFCAKARSLLADTADEIVKEDSRVTVGRVHFVPGDPPSTPFRKVESQHAFARSRPPADDG